MSKRKMSLREIDAAVARTLGWAERGTGFDDQIQDPHPVTRDIAWAWSVVEATDLLADDRMLEQNDDGEWAVVQTYPYGGGRDTLATAKTAPLAICLAALAAHGIDVEATDA